MVNRVLRVDFRFTRDSNVLEGSCDGDQTAVAPLM